MMIKYKFISTGGIMKRHISIYTMLVILISIFIISCGGGGGGGSSSGGGIGDLPGGSVVTGVSAGSIEGFGSIFVNGVEFETSGAEIEFENETPFQCSPSLSDDCGLKEGMLVAMESTFDDNGATGTVSRIRFEDNLEGPIGAFAETTPGFVKTLTIMAQTVIVQNGLTQFDNSDPGFDDFSDLGPGNLNNVVEVSGFVNSDGSIRASFIERKALGPVPGDIFEIQGNVSNLSPNTFQINSLTIDFTGLVPRNGTLANGVNVEVKGDNIVGNTLNATDVEIKPAGLGVDNVAKAKIEGYTANHNTSVRTFSVNGQLVNYATATFFGGTEAELANGVKVEAEGPISGGVLQAVKVEFKDGVRFEANADTVNPVSGTLTLEGLPGITVQADGLTRFDGVANLGGINSGDNLRIRGRRFDATSTTIVATEVELRSTTPDDRTIIRGNVDSFVAFGSVTIIGVEVDTTTIQDDDFKDNDTIIGEAAFFNQLNNDDLVKARLDLSSGNWDQIEFED